MAYDKIVKLVEKLHERTINGKVQWEKLIFEEGIYQAIFPGYTIRISQIDRGGLPFIVIQIYNEDGELVEEVDDSDVAKEHPVFVAYELMSDLLENARRIAMGSDKAIDKILSALGNDDDIPF